MDKRELSIIIGQCINLAHSEAMKITPENPNLVNEYIEERVPHLLRLSLELRKKYGCINGEK